MMNRLSPDIVMTTDHAATLFPVPTPNGETIPCLPESAPFTLEQRAYLNGFLAGLFSRGHSSPPVPAGLATPASAAQPALSLTILFGSQTGNAESLARKISKAAVAQGFLPTVYEMNRFPASQLAQERHVLLVASTFGDGDPPDNAVSFWEFLQGESAPRLESTRFSVCALGDSSYAEFCAFGKKLDARFEALGATRVHPRQDCDVDFDEPFQRWLGAALAALSALASASETNGHHGSASGMTNAVSAPGRQSLEPSAGPPACPFSRKQPFPGRLILNRRLNGPGSSKDTRHIAVSILNSGLTYEAGDAMGVAPVNDWALVEDLTRALRCSGEEPVPLPDGSEAPLRVVLRVHCDIKRIPQALLQCVAEQSADAKLQQMAAPGANGELTRYLLNHEIIDLLRAFPAVRFEPAAFVALLKKLQPRLYSISSSPKAHPREVHLTVGVVRYESLGRPRHGVCSTFLADRSVEGDIVPVFIHANKSFRLPEDKDRPILMVGPGTGIAPFRAFLQERQALGSKGPNWLFFGDQHAREDFLYRKEIETFLREGILTRLDLAWSRDQPEKHYVQHRMMERAAEIYDWLEQGAFFYVCGDASRMARDVDTALHQVIERAGQKTAEQAAAYVRQLKSAKRYLRDVY